MRSIFLLLLVKLTGAALPTIFPVCLRNDPQLSDCMIQTVKIIQSRMSTGDLGGGFRIPRLEPFHIPGITYGREQTLQTRMMDLYLKGFSKFSIDKFNVNIQDLKFDMFITIPQIEMRSNYKMTLGYLGRPRYSEGQIYERLANTKMRIFMQARLYQQNGQIYLRFDPIYVKILENTVKALDFTNFFPNLAISGPLGKSFLQLNGEYFTKEIYPSLEKNFSDIFTNIANQIVIKAPFDEIFPA